MPAENKKTFNLPDGFDPNEFQALVDEVNNKAWNEAVKGTSLDNSPSDFVQELDRILLKGKGSEALPQADTALDNQEVLRGRRRRGAARRERVERGKRTEMKGAAQTVQTTPVSAAQEVAKQEADPYAEIVPGQAWQRQSSVNGKNVVEVISLLAVGADGIPVIKRTLDGNDNLFAIHPNTIDELREELRKGQYQLDLSVSLSDKPEMPEQWTEERLLREVPEGEFTLKNNQGTMRFYRRQGDAFLNRSGKVVPLTDVLDKLQSGRWKFFEIPVQMDASLSPDLLKGRNPKDYSQIIPGDVWVLQTARGEVIDSLKVNLILSRGKDKKRINVNSRLGEAEKSLDPEHMFTDGAKDNYDYELSEYELRNKLATEGYVLVQAGTVPDQVSESASQSEQEGESDPYVDLDDDDEWVAQNDSGTTDSIHINNIREARWPRKGKWVNFSSVIAGKRETNQKMQYEELLAKLKERGFVLVNRTPGEDSFTGSVGEQLHEVETVKKVIDPLHLLEATFDAKVRFDSDQGPLLVNLYSSDFYTVALMSGAVVGHYSETNIRRLAEREHWQYVGIEEGEAGTAPQETRTGGLDVASEERREEQPPRPELSKPNTEEEAKQVIETLKAQLAEARDTFVRIESNEQWSWKRVFKVLGTFAGQETEVTAEVAQAREGYKNALMSLQSAEIERLKLSNPVGEVLRQEIARIVREYDFVEAEALDDKRRDAKYAEEKNPLGPKILKLWEEAKPNLRGELDQMTRLEAYAKLVWGVTKVGGEGLVRANKATGRLYNKINSTKLGKAALIGSGVAGAGVLFFSGGGAAAAAAGVFLAAKRGMAGAGIAIGAKEAADALAKQGRDRRSQKKAEQLAKDFLATSKNEALTAFTSNIDLNQPEPRVIGVSEESLREFEKFLAAETVGKFEKRDARRRAWALWRKTGAITAGVTFGSGAFGQVLSGGMREGMESMSESGTAFGNLEQAARRAGEAAGAPASAASAAEQVASAPAGGASAAAQAASAAEARLPVTGGPGTLPSGGPGVSSELPNALNQSPEFYRSGLPIDTAKLDGVLGERAVARGDTIWKYALESGKAAGFDEKGQARFAALLREKLVEKLSTVDPDVAKAAGFTPNADGVFTPDFIRAGDTLHLDKILTSNEMQELATQAQQATGATGEVAPTGKPDIFNTSYTSLTEAAKDAVKEYGTVPDLNKEYTNLVDAAKDAVRLYGEVGTQSPVPSPGVVQEAVSAAEVSPQDNLLQLMEEKGLNKNAASKALAEYLSDLNRSEQVKVFQGIRGTVRDLFNTPEISIYNNYDANYDLSVHPELAQASVVRVLNDHEALSNRAFYMYDRSTNPLHWTQMQQVAQFNETAIKALGRDMAKPLLNEGISDYTRRIAILAHAKGITFPGLRVIQ